MSDKASPDTTIRTDFEGLKRMSKEFLDCVGGLNESELENAFKAFGLAYLGCEYPDNLIGRAPEQAGAPALMKFVSTAYFERLFVVSSKRNELERCA